MNLKRDKNRVSTKGEITNKFMTKTLRILIWFVMFVSTCVAGTVIMARLNNHPGTVSINTTTTTTTATTAVTPSISSAISTTPKMTTTAPTYLAMLLLCTKQAGNWFESFY